MQVRGNIADYENLMLELRRKLHSMPELSDAEYRTQEYVLGFLQELGLDHVEKIAETGIKGVIYTGGAKETIGFRADMDALCIQEQTGVPYASCNAGMMHACGHDGHMALLMGFAKWCTLNRDKLKYNIVFIFQPGEEGTGGAKRMIEAGVLENPHVDRLYGYHLMPEVPVGSVAVKAGLLMAGVSEFDIEITGKSAHGAMPNKGIDALAISAECYFAIQNLLTRTLPTDTKALISIGKIQGGTARNIVAGNAIMEGTMRTFEDEIYTHLRNGIEKKILAIANASGGNAKFTERVRYPAVINSCELADATKALMEPECIADSQPLMIAEDFSFYQRRTKGLFMFLGCGSTQPLHSPKFNFDERVLMYGMELYIRIVEN